MTGQNIPPELAGAVLTVDLRALQANYRMLAKKSGKAACGAAIKGDAYGLGLVPVARALWSVGCRNFFVARPMEGGTLRAVLPKATIYVLDGLATGQAAYYARHDLRPALISMAEAREWASFGRQNGGAPPCAIHVDTGINRLGFSLSDFNELSGSSQLLNELNPSLVMSHLACADNPAHRLNAKQIARFNALRERLPDVPMSLSNSSGIFLKARKLEQLTRPGVALYGGNPTPGKKNPMKPVARLEGLVLQIRDVKKGDTIGYSATWKAPRDSRIALLGAGYRDGIPRMLSSRQKDGPAQVHVGGRRCPIVGRVSMDMMAVDVTALPPGKVKRGSRAEIFGVHIPVDEAADWAGTISYELLTRLGSRYARVYEGATDSVKNSRKTSGET